MCFEPRKYPRHLILEPAPQPGWLSRHWIKLVVSATLLLLTLALADLASAETGTEDVGAGQLHYRTAAGYAQATHLQSEAQVTITGMVARLVLKQTFINDTDQWQETRYVFPLPETGAVNFMAMELGGRRIVARIREREEAEKIYQAAVQAGKTAALTRQERPNLFTQKVGNLAPGASVSIELHVTSPVHYDSGRFSWRLPMTLTPRYIPGQPQTGGDDGAAEQTDLSLDGNGWASATDQVSDATNITPFYQPPATGLINPMQLNIQLDAGLPLSRISGSYHEISIDKTEGHHQIGTLTPQIPMDRDFELAWWPVASELPSAALFLEQKDGERYALLMLLPSPQPASHPLPRDVTFIIDTSGSMSGPSIEQARASLALALARLNPNDRFNVIEFNSVHSLLFSQPQPASAANLSRAQQFVAGLQADGGTEMAPALEAALSSEAIEGWLRQVVFITDGSVGNEQALFALIHEQLGQARLFTVGIGSAPNSHFMRKAAQFGRGDFVHIGDASEVANKMRELFGKLESAALTQLQLDWPAGISAEVWPQRLPDLYQGAPLLLAAKLEGRARTEAITLSGQSASGPWSQRLIAKRLLDSPAADARDTGIASLWARAKIDALLDGQARGESRDSVRQKVLPIALAHQLLSPFTSFVAVDETPEARRPDTAPLQKTAIGNQVPAGQQVPALMYPRTATPAPLYLLIGLISGAGWLLLALRRRWARG